MKCTATTLKGRPCRNHATRGGDRCSSHRRAALDQAAVEQLLSMLRVGNYLEVAARATGVSLDEVPVELRDELETARAEGELRSVARIAAAAVESWQAAAFLLERQYPDRWGRPAVRQEGEKTPVAVAVGVDSLDELAAKRGVRRAARS
jgi:hypothetical protein